jgi:excisionase family DNA binding protein
MTQRYMSVHETALYLGCTETSVRQRVKRANIPFIRDGRRIRFDKDDIDRYLAARKVRRRERQEP